MTPSDSEVLRSILTQGRITRSSISVGELVFIGVFYHMEIICRTNQVSFPLSFMIIMLLPFLATMFCTAYKYRICMAEVEFKIYEVSLSSLAVSTSAWAEMMVA